MPTRKELGTRSIMEETIKIQNLLWIFRADEHDYRDEVSRFLVGKQSAKPTPSGRHKSTNMIIETKSRDFWSADNRRSRRHLVGKSYEYSASNKNLRRVCGDFRI